VYAGDVFAEAVPTDTVLRPLNLSEQEISDVVAFLESLNEPEPVKFLRSSRIHSRINNCFKTKG
jgi:pyruvate-formate lyase-activating enzyme